MDVLDVLNEIKEGKNEFDVGKITKVKDFVVEVVGLDNVTFYEEVNLANKGIGYVTKILSDVCMVSILSLGSPLVVGDEAIRTNKTFKGKYSGDAIGRMINIFGQNPLNGKTYESLIDVPIEEDNIPIMDRSGVNEQLETGIAGIDLMYPIGLGQRQLIIGDKKTGKTQIVLDTIVNQKGKNIVCIYCPVGKTMKEVKQIYYNLMKHDAMKYTIIIPAFNDYLAPALVLTPYYALSVARRFMEHGTNVLVVIDDLKRHADAYREISLLTDKAPGRDAYPSDIFYLHSRLLEKGCKYKNGASITILPIVETRGEDITDYISTNIISITDGQIVLSSKNFQKGIKPAINYGLSVSRLGGAVQPKDMKKLGTTLRRKLLSYLEMASIYELSNQDDLSPSIREEMARGKKIISNLSQPKYEPLTNKEMLEKFNFILENNDGEH